MSHKTIVAALFAVAALHAPARAGDGMTKVKEIELAGGGGFDYVYADPAGGRIYVAHSPKIDVIDAKKLEKVGEVDGVDGAHGTAIQGKKGFATAGRKSVMVVFDTGTLKVLKEVKTGANPDAICSVTSAKEVWAFNGRDKSATCVDAESLEVKATIPLGGKPETGVEDAATGTVYVNLEDKNQIAVIDVKKHEVTGTIDLGAEEPAGLAFDAKDHLLFAGCGGKKLVVVDGPAKKVVSSYDIGDHCDACAFDAERGVIFASCGDGTTSMVKMKDAKTFEPLKALETQKGARTCAVEPSTHMLFACTGPRRNEKGSVKLLVFKPAE
jgi:hypothetical protein